MAAPARIAPPGPHPDAGRTKPPGRTPTRTPGRTPGGRTTVVRPTAATPPRGPRATAPPRRTTTTCSTLVGARFCSFGPGIGPLSAWAGALNATDANATIAATEPLM